MIKVERHLEKIELILKKCIAKPLYVCSREPLKKLEIKFILNQKDEALYKERNYQIQTILDIFIGQNQLEITTAKIFTHFYVIFTRVQLLNELS